MRVIWQENPYRIVETKNKNASFLEQLKERIFAHFIGENYTQAEEEQMFVDHATRAGIYSYGLEKWNGKIWEMTNTVSGFIGKYDPNTIEGYYAYEHTIHEKHRLTYIQEFKKIAKIASSSYREIIIEKILDTLRDTPFLNELDLNDQEKQTFMDEKRKIRKELEILKNSNPL